jgi:hypothetical protein
MRNAYKIFIGIPEGKKPLGRPGRRLEDNIGMEDMRETWWVLVNWMHLTEDRDQWKACMNTVMSIRVP